MAFDQNAPNYTGGDNNGYKYQNTTPKIHPIPKGTIAVAYNATTNVLVATPTNLDPDFEVLNVTVQDQTGKPARGVIDVGTPAAINISTSGLSKKTYCWTIFVQGYKPPVNGVASQPYEATYEFQPLQNFSHTFNN